MGVMTSLRYGLARMLVKTAGFSVTPTWVRSSFIVPTFDRLVSEGYQKNALVAALISVFTFTLPEPPLMAFDGEGEKAQPLPDHPLRKLLRRPNPIMGEDELWQYTAAYAALGGNAYWVCTLDAVGRPAEKGAWPYHAGQVRPKPGGNEWVTGYEFFNGDGEWQDIDLNKYAVVHFKWPLPDPTQPWMAQPPLRSVAGSVDTIAEIDTYIYALLKNNAIPPILVKLPKDREMDKPEKDRFRAQWQAMYGGDKRGGVAILDDGADVSVLGLNLQQLAVDALYRVPETRIAAAFRVPPILAGLLSGLDASTYSNYEQARKSFTQDTLVPLWRAWGAEVESALGERYKIPVYLHHDLSMVASLQEDVQNKWTRVNTAFMSGLLAFDEARKQLGYEKPADDALFMTRKSFSMVFARDVMNPESPQVLDLPLTMPALTEETQPMMELEGA
jgi:HK97 family phage portal protein